MEQKIRILFVNEAFGSVTISYKLFSQNIASVAAALIADADVRRRNTLRRMLYDLEFQGMEREPAALIY